MSATPVNQIAVIDTQLPDYPILEQAARAAGLEVLLLSGQGDGVAELAAALAGRSGIAALHIVSHGSSGQIQLGNAALNSTTLDAYAAELAVIRQALTEDGDLLVYGCNVGATISSREFLGSLSHLSGADIAASTDATGSAALGANWKLEFSQGAVNTSTLFIEAWQHQLVVGQYILGDGSGGGGGGRVTSIAGNGGTGGTGGGGNDAITGTAGADVIFGDGSGGGGGSPNTGTSGPGGAGGGGSDTISGGDDNDVIFGDGFSGGNATAGWPKNAGKGGLGGGGGGGNEYDTVTLGGVGGLGAGSGVGRDAADSPIPLVSGFGNKGGGSFTSGNGGNSATDSQSNTGSGALKGGGGGFGGAAGGIGNNHPSSPASGANGDTNQHTYDDTTGAIRNYFSDAVLRSVLSNYPSYGAGADTLDGGGGSDELFGLGGNDTFIFDLSAAGATDTDRVWDFSKGDKLLLKDASGNALDNSALATLYSNKTIVDADGDSTSDDLQMVLSGSGKQITIQLINTSTLQIGNGNFIYPNQSPSFGAGQTLVAVNEDTVAPAGATVSSLLNGTYTDTDSDSFAGVAIAGNAANTSTEGAWQYTTDGGSNWHSVGTPSTSAALLIQNDGANTKLRFVPVANYNGTPGALTVFAVDNSSSATWTSGATTQTFDTTADDTTSKVSAAGVSLGTSITAVNDNPALASLPASVTVIEDTASNVDLSAATLSDPDSASSNITLTITAGAGTLAASGGGSVTVSNSGTSALTLSGTASNIDTFLNTASNIQYTGASNAYGSSATTLTLTANDGGNTGSGGGTNVSLGSVAVNITGVADAPSVTNASTTATTQTTSGLVLSRNVADSTEVTHFKITGITNGNLFKSDGTTAISNGDFITYAEGNAGLKFTPTGGGNGSFTAQASTSAADGGLGGSTVTSITVATPALSSATYNASTGVLVATGSAMEAKTGVTNDITVSKLTLTGEGGTTYALTSSDVEITSATEFSVTLNATDQAAVNQILNKTGATSTGGTTFNIAAADDWNAQVTTGDTSDATNTLTVSNPTTPTITSATYNYATNTLVVTGTGFLKLTGASNEVDISKLTLTGEGGATYTITSATDVEITSGTQFSVTLSGADLTGVEALLNKDGTSSVGSTTYNLAGAEDWAAGADAAVNVVDLTSNGITVSNWAAPTVTSATYDWTTGQLVITGTNFVSASGATNDLVANLLTLTGEGGSYTLTDSANVEITSATSATVTLSATDKLNIHGLLNKNGLSSSGATTYNLAAADNWMAGSPAASDIADASGNGITVSNVATPTITSATYDSDTGILVVTGTNLFKKVGATNDVDVQKLTFTGQGGGTYTIAGGTSDVEITSATSFTMTLSGADKTGVDALLNQIGTQSTGGTTYNLAGADAWLAAQDSAANIADASNAITVSITPTITSATYDANTGTLVVTGANIQANGGGMDIDVSKLTLTGEGSSTYTLTTTSIERDSATQFTVTLNATDKAAASQILNKTGTASTGGTTFNIAAADDWNTQVTAGDTADATNAVTVSNPDTPTLTSATYDASTGALVVTGTGFLKLSGATNDIDVSKLTLTGEAAATYTLTTSSVEITNGTSFTVTLNATDLAGVNQILNKTGTASTGSTTYNLAGAEDWAAGAAAAVTVADTTGNGITVSNPTTPTITSATYNTITGALVITGTGFLKLSGATNEIVANKLTITGQGNATYTLTDTANVDITSATTATLTLSSTDKTGVNALINKAGISSNDNTTYNLAAAEDWAAGAAAAVNVADLTSNGITATLNQAPAITSNGSGATASINVAENGTAVTTVTATDADAHTVTFSLTGGADQAKFSINATTGVLTFASAPDFESPTDTGANNTYVVDVTASDGNGGTDVQTITVTVTDVGEGGGGSSDPPAPRHPQRPPLRRQPQRRSTGLR